MVLQRPGLRRVWPSVTASCQSGRGVLVVSTPCAYAAPVVGFKASLFQVLGVQASLLGWTRPPQAPFFSVSPAAASSEPVDCPRKWVSLLSQCFVMIWRSQFHFQGNKSSSKSIFPVKTEYFYFSSFTCQAKKWLQWQITSIFYFASCYM
jgi:hypothetical protein